MACKKILLLGATGKMGCALKEVFSSEYSVICVSSRDFDALDPIQVEGMISTADPDIVINAVAMLGIDPCETEPEKAMQINALYPKILAELSRSRRYLLIHFSSDAVFDGGKGDFYYEDDIPCPLNVYGKTKLMGDAFVRNCAERYYLIRVSVLFGESVKENQFVEKMLARMACGEKFFTIADDLVFTPTYALDVACEVKKMIEQNLPFGLYHVASQDKGSLFELMAEVVACLGLNVVLQRGSYRDFPAIGTKNTCTPLASKKIRPLRPWRDGVRAYCQRLVLGRENG